jgi:hypothetical protein
MRGLLRLGGEKHTTGENLIEVKMKKEKLQPEKISIGLTMRRDWVDAVVGFQRERDETIAGAQGAH